MKDVEPIIPKTTRELLVWPASLDLRGHFKERIPDGYVLVVKPIDRRRRGGDETNW